MTVYNVPLHPYPFSQISSMGTNKKYQNVLYVSLLTPYSSVSFTKSDYIYMQIYIKLAYIGNIFQTLIIFITKSHLFCDYILLEQKIILHYFETLYG